MKFEIFEPYTSPKKRNKKPFVLVGRGEGCGLEGCHCSNGYWVSVSNGKIGIFVKFKDAKEMKKMLRE